MKKEKRAGKGGLGGMVAWKGAGPISQENTNALNGKMDWKGSNNNVPENRKQTDTYAGFKE
jgi:hypothetical protein